jgi:hypothetical protein
MRWRVQLPPVAPPAMSVLNGVSCTSAARCIAVGYVEPDPSSAFRPLVERWNGSAWSIVSTPKTSPFEPAVLNAVSCAKGSCTAVGILGYRELLERWDGGKWSIQPVPKGAPDAVLNGVSCVSPTDCVTVGGLTNGSGQSIAERWNGSRWSIERTPTVSGSVLNGVSCVSGRDCFAVRRQASGPLIERWNGATWSTQSTI